MDLRGDKNINNRIIILFAFLLALQTAISEFKENKKLYHESQTASAVLRPIQGNNAAGEVSFQAMPGGVWMIGEFRGLTPDKDGFYIREKGDYNSADAFSAACLYNPMEKSHGGPDDFERYVGDIGNIISDLNGGPLYVTVDGRLSLSGAYSIASRSVVIHGDEDGLKSQPSGNSGARMTYDVIEIEAKKE